MESESLQLDANPGDVPDSHMSADNTPASTSPITASLIRPDSATVPGTHPHVLTLDEIATLAAEEGKPAETLMNVVALIARRFETDVCSAYLLEPDRANLVLAATVGLRPECIGTLRMALHEGLAGLVAEQVRPVAVEQVKQSPALQIFSRSRRRRLPVFPRRSPHRSRRPARRAGRADQSTRASSAKTRFACSPKLPPRSRPSSAKRARSTASSLPRRNGSGRWPAISGGAGTTTPVSLFRDLDPLRWRQLNHNPVALLSEMSAGQARDAAPRELVLHSRINYAYRRQQEYLQADRTWGARHAGVLRPRPVAYFSAEFGIHESLPIYSGGLGVLAGDHIKSASDLDIPLVGIGLFYGQGYFRQRLDRNGWQQEEYLVRPMSTSCRWKLAIGNERPTRRRFRSIPAAAPFSAKVWRVKVGRCDLLLLDSNVEGNAPEDRELTSRLYGGDGRIRIRQELLLGVGGFRALKAMGITPGVLHLNEGHSGFAVLEAIRSRMEEEGIDFDARRAPRLARSRLHHAHAGARRPRPLRRRPDRRASRAPCATRSASRTESLMGLGRENPGNHQRSISA